MAAVDPRGLQGTIDVDRDNALRKFSDSLDKLQRFESAPIETLTREFLSNLPPMMSTEWEDAVEDAYKLAEAAEDYEEFLKLCKDLESAIRDLKKEQGKDAERSGGAGNLDKKIGNHLKTLANRLPNGSAEQKHLRKRAKHFHQKGKGKNHKTQR